MIFIFRSTIGGGVWRDMSRSNKKILHDLCCVLMLAVLLVFVVTSVFEFGTFRGAGCHIVIPALLSTSGVLFALLRRARPSTFRPLWG